MLFEEAFSALSFLTEPDGTLTFAVRSLLGVGAGRTPPNNS
jgi:hypothetical protein